MYQQCSCTLLHCCIYLLTCSRQSLHLLNIYNMLNLQFIFSSPDTLTAYYDTILFILLIICWFTEGPF